MIKNVRELAKFSNILGMMKPKVYILVNNQFLWLWKLFFSTDVIFRVFDDLNVELFFLVVVPHVFKLV